MPTPPIECRPCCPQRAITTHPIECRPGCPQRDMPTAPIEHRSGCPQRAATCFHIVFDSLTQQVKEEGAIGPPLSASEVTPATGQLMSRRYCSHSNSDGRRQRSCPVHWVRKDFSFHTSFTTCCCDSKKPVGFIELMSKKNIFGERVNFVKVLQSPGH